MVVDRPWSRAFFPIHIGLQRLIHEDDLDFAIKCVNALEGINPEAVSMMREVCRLASRFDNVEDGGPSALSIRNMAHAAISKAEEEIL